MKHIVQGLVNKFVSSVGFSVDVALRSHLSKPLNSLCATCTSSAIRACLSATAVDLHAAIPDSKEGDTSNRRRVLRLNHANISTPRTHRSSRADIPHVDVYKGPGAHGAAGPSGGADVCVPSAVIMDSAMNRVHR
jgi:hypothetical protein